MKIEPEGAAKIRSASRWMLAMVVVVAVNGLLALVGVRSAPLTSLVGVVVCGWLAFALGRAGLALSRPPSAASLRDGILATRSFFRAAVVSLCLAIAAGAVPTPLSCDLELEWEDNSPKGAEDAGEQQIVRKDPAGPLAQELARILVASLFSCSDVDSDQCADASEEAGAARAPLFQVPSEFAGVTSRALCQRGNFAQMEFGTTHLSEDVDRTTRVDAGASFVRTDTGAWFLLTVNRKGDWPEACEVLPFHKLAKAKETISRRPLRWVVGDEGDFVPLERVLAFNCVLEKVEVRRGQSKDPIVIDPGCWFSDGWRAEPDAERFVIDTPLPSEISITVEFKDGSRVSSVVENPRPEEGEAKSPATRSADLPEGPDTPAESPDEPEGVENDGKPGAIDGGDEPEIARTYAEAATILEPCWRMLSDDLPIRTAQRCREAYDRTIDVVGDDGQLAVSLREAAEVGRAWGDADAGLVARPSPTAEQRRKLKRKKGEARRRELDLLPARTIALSEFARSTMDEVSDETVCNQKKLLLLHALEELPVEFDAASDRSSSTALTELGAAVSHATTALRYAKEACSEEAKNAEFLRQAAEMAKDVMELATARREHSRCAKGRLHEVCARPGGLEPHRRIVLLAAIRSVQEERL